MGGHLERTPGGSYPPHGGGARTQGNGGRADRGELLEDDQVEDKGQNNVFGVQQNMAFNPDGVQLPPMSLQVEILVHHKLADRSHF